MQTDTSLIAKLATRQGLDGGNSMELGNQHEKSKGSDLPVATEERPSRHEEASQSAAPLNLLSSNSVQTQMKQANEALLGTAIGDATDEIKALLSKLNPDDETQYLNPMHFVQLSGRKGGVIMLPHYSSAEGQTLRKIVFENGTFSTTDVMVVQAIRIAIKRAGGCANVYKEISEAHYQKLFDAGRSAQKIRGMNGFVSTSDSLPNGGQSNVDMAAEMAKLKEENAKLMAMVNGAEKIEPNSPAVEDIVEASLTSQEETSTQSKNPFSARG